MTGFWKTWMQAWCWFTALFGAVLAAMAFPATQAPGDLFFRLVSGFTLSADYLDGEGLRFAIAVLGAVMIGWGLVMYGAVRVADRAGPVIWQWMTWAMVVWFVVDSALSVATGFPINAVTNAIFAAGYFVPVLATGVLRSEPATATA